GVVGAVVGAALGQGGASLRGGVVGPVEPQPAAGVDACGHRVGPPVDQIEVVGGLVDEQAAAVGLVAVPAPEVVGPVGGVQDPLEVHRDHLADLSGGDDLLQGGV